MTTLCIALLASCSTYWIVSEVDDEFVWRRGKLKSSELEGSKVDERKCNFSASSPVSMHKEGEYSVYGFDSIRIIIHEHDTVLNYLTQIGLIQGVYFFSDHKGAECNRGTWHNPYKSDHGDWVGYKLRLERLREVKNNDG